MTLVFFGTPDFASRCLEKILSSKHNVLAVVTAPDKPRGRGMKVEPPDVKRLALQRRLEILQPPELKEPSFIQKLSSLKADIFCVVAFRILPEDVFSIPPKGCINLHASLLPKYRGAAPINWALFNGETETGVTTFFIRRQVDTGDMILQQRLAIGPEETFGELYARMVKLGSEVLLETIDLIDSGRVKTACQDNSLASAAPKLTPEMGNIDWTAKTMRIHNLIRGLSPKPGAYSYLDGKKVIILRSRPTDFSRPGAEPGAVIQADPSKGIALATGDGALEILELKPESGRKITGAEYVRGHTLTIGKKFERNFGK